MSNQSIPPTKRCTKCGDHLPATSEYFSPEKQHSDGLKSRCKRCNAQQIQQWREKNRDKYLQSHRKQETNRRRRNPERYKELHSASGKRRRAKHNEEVRRYNNTPHGKLIRRATYKRYIARKMKAEGNHTADDIKKQYNRQKGRCYYCGKQVHDTYEVDHVIPLSRGGSNGTDNIVIACGPCNKHKSAKMPHEWSDGGKLC